MITCLQADVLAAALSVGSIDGDDQATLLLHLGSCAACRRSAGEYMAAAARLPLALEPAVPSPELRGRLMRAVYDEAARSRERSARPSTWSSRLWHAIPASRGLTLGAAAAAAAVSLLSWGLAARHPASPATVAMTLVGTAAAPHAHAELTYDRATHEAVLTASGLPSPGAVVSGRAVYEVWLVRANGSAVAAAYLSHEPDGTWSAVVSGDMTAYSAVAATPEPAGGSPSPTGARVLQGTIAGT